MKGKIMIGKIGDKTLNMEVEEHLVVEHVERDNKKYVSVYFGKGGKRSNWYLILNQDAIDQIKKI
jgi:hypothetical protein